ncbi:MAG: HIT family protein [Proteobacteria bacterium]|nr:HIT family protein [Pseudomonadota bacterium]
MNEDCIFCKIVSGEIPSTQVYEDERFFAFMDIYPGGRGHFMLVPKAHHQDLEAMPDDLLSQVLPLARKLAAAAVEGLGAEGLNLVQSNGRAATQLIPHFHLHFFPRWTDDGTKVAVWDSAPGDMDRIAEDAERIRAAL